MGFLMQFDALCFEVLAGCGPEIGRRVKSPGLPCIIAKIGDCGAGEGGLHGAVHNCINNGLAKTRCIVLRSPLFLRCIDSVEITMHLPEHPLLCYSAVAPLEKCSCKLMRRR